MVSFFTDNRRYWMCTQNTHNSLRIVDKCVRTKEQWPIFAINARNSNAEVAKHASQHFIHLGYQDIRRMLLQSEPKVHARRDFAVAHAANLQLSFFARASFLVVATELGETRRCGHDWKTCRSQRRLRSRNVASLCVPRDRLLHSVEPRNGGAEESMESFRTGMNAHKRVDTRRRCDSRKANCSNEMGAAGLSR